MNMRIAGFLFAFCGSCALARDGIEEEYGGPSDHFHFPGFQIDGQGHIEEAHPTFGPQTSGVMLM